MHKLVHGAVIAPISAIDHANLIIFLSYGLRDPLCVVVRMLRVLLKAHNEMIFL